MKSNINVLVIDDNPSVVSSIKEYFSSHAVINIVKTIDNGKEALNHILAKTNDYDLIIMDIIMPEVDGIEILKKMRADSIDTKVLVLTSYKKDYTVKLTNNYDISYYMLKPFSLESLENHIIEICNEEKAVVSEENNLEFAISKLLHSLGIPSHIKGYQYIRESVSLMYQNPNLISGITKEVYPEIAMRYDTTASRVERAIRHAIEVSWNRGDYDLMEEIFGHSVDYDRAKPTNSEFIATLADKLRIDKRYIEVNS